MSWDRNEYTLAVAVDDVRGKPTTVESAAHRRAPRNGAHARVLADGDVAQHVGVIADENAVLDVGWRLPWPLRCLQGDALVHGHMSPRCGFAITTRWRDR